MSIRTWVFLAVLAMMLVGVGGVSATYAQESIDCPLPHASTQALEQAIYHYLEVTNQRPSLAFGPRPLTKF